MKKLFTGIFLAMFVVAGCESSQIEVTVDQFPVFVKGESSEFILEVTEGDELINGFSVTATLEMTKMDHGVIGVSFEDVGKGLYKGKVELPMGGEWIADIQVDSGDSTVEEVVTFEVEER